MKKKIFRIMTAVIAALTAACPVITAFAEDRSFTDNFVSKLTPLRIIVCLFAGFVIAFAIVMKMKGKLYSVYYDNYAGRYIEDSTSEVTYSDEIFEYEKVEKTPLPKNNN